MATEKTPPRVIQMDDGRSVEFTAKQKLVKTPIQNPDGSLQLRLDFENGETRLVTLQPSLLAKFALHGASQKFGDEISGIEKIEDCVEAIDQLMQRTDKGEWTAERLGGGGMAGASELARALVKVTGQSIQVVRDFLATKDAKVKAALRLDPSVAAAIKDIQAERAARQAASGKASEKVDTAALLGSLGVAPV